MCLQEVLPLKNQAELETAPFGVAAGSIRFRFTITPLDTQKVVLVEWLPLDMEKT